MVGRIPASPAPGYRTGAILSESRSTLVLRSQRVADDCAVVLKFPRSDHPDHRQLARYRNEFTLLQGLDCPGVIRGLGLERRGDGLLLVLEDFGAESLAALCRRQSFSVEDGLQIFVTVTEALSQLHERGILHRDVNPSNIVCNPATGQCKLIDFGLACRLSPTRPGAFQGETLEGTLAYLPPEQTGRTNRPVDYRSDLYSLGVTFYEFFSGRLPFDAQEPLAMVHAHIAGRPTPLAELDPKIPQMLSDIVGRLMAKSADQRYQSAAGLHADLAACLRALRGQGTIPRFELGRDDRSSIFYLPQHLYGREREVASLREIFEERVVGRGEAVFQTICGYAGTGKTSLVREFCRLVTDSDAFVIEGKFDQYQRNIPYYALRQAFAQLVDRWLALDEAGLAAIANALRDALGSNAAVMFDLVPSLEQVIGPQPQVPALSGVEAQNRFQNVCRAFFSCAATAGHPLILFIDDLQWADLASLNLIAVLLIDRRVGHLMLIGAWRDNETPAAHPLLLLLHRLEAAPGLVATIRVGNLSPEDVAALCADALHTGVEIATPLALLVHAKTLGNPFFVGQFLRALHEEGLIAFDAATRKWTWDVERIRRRAIPDDVVQLLAIKIATLDAGTQRLLTLAACIGNAFSLATLAVIAEQPADAVRDELAQALREGLLIGLDDQHFRFSHDRIQQAAYTLAADSERLHLAIGRLLLAEGEPTDEALFRVVHQLNAASRLITETAERLVLARLNAQAGRRARDGAAYASARRYLTAAAQLLPTDAWSSQRDLAFDIHAELAWCRFYAGETEGIEALFATLIEHARGWEDLTRVHVIRAEHYHLAGDYGRAVAIQKEALEALGVDLDEDAIGNLLQRELEAVPRLLGGRRIDALLDATEMDSPRQAAIMDVLMRLWTSAYLASQLELVAWSSCKMTSTSLEFGNSRLTSYGYMNYAFVCVAMLGQYETGHEFGRVAMRLAERYDDLLLRGKVYLLFAVFVNHWRAPLASSLEYSLKSFPLLVDNGDWTYAAYCAEFIVSDPTIWGMHCDEILAAADGYLPFLENNAPVVLDEFVRPACLNPVLQLVGKTRSTHTFDDDHFAEATFLERFRNNPLALSYYYTAKLRSLYWFGHWDDALAMLDQVEFVSGVALAQAKIPEIIFYASLTILGAHERLSAADRERLAERVAAYQARMQIWAENSPANFRHKFLLVEAERARIDGRDWQALSYFESAIDEARKAGYLNNQALASERAGAFCLDRGQTHLATVFLHDARYAWQRWGASAKVANLEQRYAAFFVGNRFVGDGSLPTTMHGSATHSSTTQSSTTHGPTVHGSTTHGSATHAQQAFGSGGEGLDMLSIVQASQSLAGEIELGRLLDRMMKIASQNAGADRCVLLIADDGRWRIRAETRPTWAAVAITEGAAAGNRPNAEANAKQLVEPEANPDVALGIVHFCARRKQSLLLGNARAQGNFVNDPYVVAHASKSVLCVPLLHSGTLKGLLYLENNQVEDAFTEQRLQVLELLSSQMAISMENASFYRDLERRVAERTQELVQLNAKLEAANRTLDALSKLDGLTQIANRRLLDETLEAEWRRHLRTRKPLAFVLCDIDYFKAYNDTCGHLAGDGCLRQVATAIAAAAKRPGDLAARYGGEEFALVLPETGLDGVSNVITAIQANVAALAIRHESSAAERFVTLSLGAISLIPDPEEELTDMLAHADEALYQAKTRGRNQAVIVQGGGG